MTRAERWPAGRYGRSGRRPARQPNRFWSDCRDPRTKSFARKRSVNSTDETATSAAADRVPSRIPRSDPVARGHAPVPGGADLRDPALGRVFDVHDAPPLPVPFGPFEVVHQRPQVVPLQLHPVLDGLVRLDQMVTQVVDARLVVHGPVLAELVRDGLPFSVMTSGTS